jgi:diguanylate cyclase (GGDEF)-like protein/putative nucleotidyltransferase with HDIG domain
MAHPRSARRQLGGRRPLLLALVYGVFLVLVGVTASGLVAVAGSHIRSAALQAVVERDHSLVELFVVDRLQAGDLTDGGPTPTRARELASQLALLTEGDAILRIEVRGTDGRVLFSDDPALAGEQAPLSPAMSEAFAGRPTAALLESAQAAQPAGAALPVANVVQELLPILGADRQPAAVVAMWRDAAPLLANIDAARRDIMVVTLAAAVLLAGILFFVFRAAQARISNQQRQLLEATRRDALTGLLNHGAVVGLLAEEIEPARDSGVSIGLALVDVDNFRLFNDNHGHEAGDEILRRVAGVLQAGVDDGADLARYGPDEFLLVQPGADAETMVDIAQAFAVALSAVSVQFGDSEELPVTTSAGIASYPEHGSSLTELLTVVAVALGEAKASGGDTLRVAELGEEERVMSGSFDVLQGLVIAVDTKDRYTKRHSEDVARYAVFLAERVGVDEETRRTIHLAGLLHDVGKIGIPDVILRKPNKLTADEYDAFKQHVALGDAIVRDVPRVDEVRAGIRHHHERWDGKGYLDGLEGDEIPLIARILAVADAFSAMTTTRPYRRALPLEEALKRLTDAADSQLDERLVMAFVQGIETASDAPLPGEEATALWRPELWVA